MDTLQKIAADLGLDIRNKNSVNLEKTSRTNVVNWLKTNGFTQSKIKTDRWFNDKELLLFDTVGGFLYAATPVKA